MTLQRLPVLGGCPPVFPMLEQAHLVSRMERLCSRWTRVIWTDSPVLEVDVELSVLGENLVQLIDVVVARSVQ